MNKESQKTTSSKSKSKSHAKAKKEGSLTSGPSQNKEEKSLKKRHQSENLTQKSDANLKETVVIPS